MSFRALLVSYVVGGLTFIPLLIAAILIPAWYLLPRAETGKSSAKEPDVRSIADDHDTAAHARKLSGDAAASGTYAVLRRYDFQAALSALNGRQNGTMAVGGNTSGDDILAAEGASTANTGSVYQSMYRSVFTGGSKNNGSTTSLLQDVDEDPSVPRRKPAPANLLYIVLRHGHLMLYDSPAQVEVKHVLSLAHHKVSLQVGNDGDPECLETNIPEADLFAKRTAIVLTPIELPNGTMQSPPQAQPKPFYLFTATNIDKEDFYHALMSNRIRPPIPRSLDSDALIKLQSSLHSSSLTAESRAIDALIGRIFLALHRTETMSSFVRAKLERKLNRIQKPAFIPSLLVQSIHLGDAGPVFSNLKLRDLNIDGEMTLSADMKYNGGLSVTLLAVAKLDLGSRFKVRTVDLALKTVMQRITGTMLLRVKPPPSNRIWFCFESIPEMDVRVEPVVSERKITYGFVLRAIEERVKIAFKEGLVKPNWDDIPMPFSDTKGTCARGGLWSDMGAGGDQAQLTIEQTLAQRNEKTISLPGLVQENGQNGDRAASTGADTTAGSAAYKMRQSMTMPTEPASDRPPRPPRPLRTASVSSPASTAVDGQNVEPVRHDDAALTSHQSRKLWRSRGTASNVVQRDALEELRGLQSRADQVANANGALNGGQNVGRRSHDAESELTGGELDMERSTTPAKTGTPSVRSTTSHSSTVASSSASSASPQSMKANMLAATVNATTAAKNWSWNAIQRNKSVIARSERKHDVPNHQPMGRGMPLPPPGQPLPGPQKGIWGSVNSLRRRPVASEQGTAASSAPELLSTGADQQEPTRHSASPSVRAASPSEEEFEPWQENSGDLDVGGDDEAVPASGIRAASTSAAVDVGSSEARLELGGSVTGSAPEVRQQEVSETRGGRSKRVAPPLPARHKHDTQGRDSAAPSQEPATRPTKEETVKSTSTELALRMAHNAVVGETAFDDGLVTPHSRKETEFSRMGTMSSPSSTLDKLQISQPVNDPEALPMQTHQTSQTGDNHSTIGVRDFSSTGEEVAARDGATSGRTEAKQLDSASEQASNVGKGGASEDKGPTDTILARMQARVAERRTAEGVEQRDRSPHKTSPSIGFSDGWPSP